MWDKVEWYPYAFSPFLQSFGGDIVDRETYQTAEGVLNGDAAIAFGEWWQGLFADKLAPGTSQDPADGVQAFGFRDGKYAMTWSGNWNAAKASRYIEVRKPRSAGESENSVASSREITALTLRKKNDRK